ncbi:unnamed protein product [Orchesella dallaii]|uniref:C2H2-type domain-containing protein n=1 Tax=Orchesella dallaii TaxID=48710 RepID=A0ABP1SB12_9HEXA
MKRNVCLVCLKTFVGPDLGSKEDGIPSSVPLLTRFFKFVENYLDLKSVTKEELLWSDAGETKEAFCEVCEVSVINPICQVYLELLSAQLRLSSQLEQLGNLLDDSKVADSDNLRDLKINALSNQLGISNPSLLEGIRISLGHLKRKQALPNVVLSSQDCREQIDMMERDKPSFHQNMEEINVEVDPMDLLQMEADDNALDLEPNNASSIGRHSDEEEAIRMIPVGSVIKIETLHDDGDTEELPSSGVLGGIPPAIKTVMVVNGIITNGLLCPNCPEVLRDEKKYHGHYRYNHQRAGIHPCQFCSKVCDTPYQLNKHVSYVHRREQDALRCPHCDASFKFNANLSQHIKAVHQPGEFTCPHCTVVFSTKKYLRAHIRRRHPEMYSLEVEPISISVHSEN